MWSDMSLCRHLLATMEGRDAQDKLSKRSPYSYPAFTLRFKLRNLVPKLTYKETKCVL